jgi:hypothetical protein
MAVMLSLSKHGGQGLYARPFDRLRVTGPLCLISFALQRSLDLNTQCDKCLEERSKTQTYEVFKTS